MSVTLKVTTTAFHASLASPKMLSLDLSLCCHQSALTGTWHWLAGHSQQLLCGWSTSSRSWLNVSNLSSVLSHLLVTGACTCASDHHTCVIRCVDQGEILQVTQSVQVCTDNANKSTRALGLLCTWSTRELGACEHVTVCYCHVLLCTARCGETNFILWIMLL